MVKKIFTFFLFIFIFNALTSGAFAFNPVSIGTVSYNDFSKNAVLGENPVWYKCFKGSMGDSAFTMHLCKFDEWVIGYYYDDKLLEPLFISGGFKGDSLNLHAYVNHGTGSLLFTGMYNNGKYAGDVELGSSRRTLKFEVEDKSGLSMMFEYVYADGREVLFKEKEDISPIVYFRDAVIWPSGIWPAGKHSGYYFMRNEICKQKGFPENILSIKDNLAENKNKFIEAYNQKFRHLVPEDLLNDTLYPAGYFYTYSDEHRLNIVYYDDNLFVTSKFSLEYRGDHGPDPYYTYIGEHSQSYAVYDLKNKIRLKLADIITEEGIKNLPKILEEYYYVSSGISGDVPLLYYGVFNGIIYPSENFVLTPGCIMFYYGRNEIGNGSASSEERIYIPLYEVEKYLKPQVKELLGK